MKKCVLEGLHTLAIAMVCMVALLGLGWPAVMMAWASSSDQTYAPSHTDRPMVERSALLAAADASMQNAH